MARIDYSINVKAIQSSSLEGKTIEAVEADIGRALGGGKSDTVWAGTAVADWSAGAPTYKDSTDGTITTGAGCDGLWIKHTGLSFADTDVVETTTVVTITGPTDPVASLSAGQAIFLPAPPNQQYTLSDNGVAVAVEYAILT